MLILQPIVENAVKYGVAKSRKPVTVRISAYEEAGRLHIKVKDDGEAAAAERWRWRGTGVGLQNVCDRLTARYGARAGCLNGADPDGGYTVHIFMPVMQQWLTPRRVARAWSSTTSRWRSSGCSCCSPAVPARPSSAPPMTARRRCGSPRRCRPTWCCSTSPCPAWTGSTSPAALSESRGRPGGGVRHRLRQFRGGGVRRRRDRLSDEAGRARTGSSARSSGCAPISPAAAAPARAQGAGPCRGILGARHERPGADRRHGHRADHRRARLYAAPCRRAQLAHPPHHRQARGGSRSRARSSASTAR